MKKVLIVMMLMFSLLIPQMACSNEVDWQVQRSEEAPVVVTTQQEGPAEVEVPFCDKHPKVCKVWRKTKAFCKETLIVVQYVGAVVTVLWFWRN